MFLPTSNTLCFFSTAMPNWPLCINPAPSHWPPATRLYLNNSSILVLVENCVDCWYSLLLILPELWCMCTWLVGNTISWPVGLDGWFVWMTEPQARHKVRQYTRHNLYSQHSIETTLSIVYYQTNEIIDFMLILQFNHLSHFIPWNRYNLLL